MSKTRMMAGIAAAGLAASAHAQLFPSVNSVGFVPVTIPPAGGIVLSGYNLRPFGGAQQISLADLFQTNQLTRGAIAPHATRIYIWNPAARSYVIAWQRPDGAFRTAAGVTNIFIRAGDGFWLQSPAAQTVARVIHLTGETGREEIFQRGERPPGLLLISNPYANPLDLNGGQINWIADGARAGAIPAHGDNIFVWTGTGYDRLFLRSGTPPRWRHVVGGALVTNRLPAGAGAWYLARGSFTNRIVRPVPPQ